MCEEFCTVKNSTTLHVEFTEQYPFSELHSITITSKFLSSTLYLLAYPAMSAPQLGMKLSNTSPIPKFDPSAS